MKNSKYFASKLLSWNKLDNQRLMPWKGEKDPYKIWLSEIILQQTRVEQGWDYYTRFVTAFPTVEKLAKAPETKIFKLWEGLGYYTRCKNCIATAKYIASVCNGKFPDKYDEILALKGIGPYTAAAIASFAFNLPYAVVDGNVFRVLSRFFGIETPVDSITGKKLFTTLANELLDKKLSGIYNQALMDFGAVVCKPRLPLCGTCCLKTNCAAFLNKKVATLPIKEKSIINKNRWFYYFIVEYNGKVYLRKRTKKDIWENLYEFLLVERFELLADIKKEATVLLKALLGKQPFQITSVSAVYLQKLTHQTIRGCFINVKITSPLQLAGFSPVSAKQLGKLPFPKFITQYLAKNE